jgi:signal-transduction protein with cAMP-binding, CBS, and nucleotidyltransferase domain
MSVSQLARQAEDVVSTNRSARIQEVANKMRDKQVGSVVVERDGKPEGIVTDRDLVMEVIAHNRDPDALIVADVMSNSIITAKNSDSVFTLCSKMREHGIRRVPVIDEDGTTDGIIALDDIIVCLEDEIDKIEQISNDLAGVLSAESPEIKM